MKTMGNQPVLTVEDAIKIFESDRRTIKALDGFNMVVHEAEFISIVGPSGCGKSTLLWAITGLHPLTSGKINLYGQRVEAPRREIGLVFQEANLLPWRNLVQNIHFPFEIMGEDPKKRDDYIQELLEATGLKGFEHHAPRELSGGMQQRASLVRALAYDPKILVMDEPFAALDAFTRDEMNLMLLDIWERTHKTIVFVTHQIPEAVYLSDRIFVMTPRPGRNSKTFEIDLPRPRPLSITTESHFFEIVGEIKRTIYDDVQRATGGQARLAQTYMDEKRGANSPLEERLDG